jgi:hypothetical protein
MYLSNLDRKGFMVAIVCASMFVQCGHKQVANVGSDDHILNPQSQLPSTPAIKSSSTIWIGMDRGAVFSQLGREHPDSVSKDVDLLFFFQVKLLSNVGLCAVEFDSADRLSHFFLVADSSAWPSLVKNALNAFGIPTRHGPLPRARESYDHYTWSFKGEAYDVWQDAYGCMFSGDRIDEVPILVTPNFPPPP